MADDKIVVMVEGGGAYRSKDKLTVEEYLHFIDSQKQLDLPVDHLREIIDMHGFGKMGKTPKRIVLEALSSLELMDLGRSTLQDDSVSSHVLLTVKEVIKDLAKLNWKECCVTTLQTFNGVNRNSCQVQFQRPEVPAPSNTKKGSKNKQKLSTVYSRAANSTDTSDGGPAGNDNGGVSNTKKGSNKKQKLSTIYSKAANTTDISDGGPAGNDNGGELTGEKPDGGLAGNDNGGELTGEKPDGGLTGNDNGGELTGEKSDGGLAGSDNGGELMGEKSDGGLAGNDNGGELTGEKPDGGPAGNENGGELTGEKSVSGSSVTEVGGSCGYAKPQFRQRRKRCLNSP